MNRRNFLENIVLVTGAAFLPLPALPSRKIECVEDVSHNYRAWREAQIEIVKQGYKIRWAMLERPTGGFRRATGHVTNDETGENSTIIFLRPWCGEDCAA